MSSPREASTTQGMKMTPKTARVETKDYPQSTTVCLVDLPHTLLVLVLRWVEALTYPDNDEVSGLVVTFLGCESLCSALQSAVKDDAVWLGLSRRYQIRKAHMAALLSPEVEVHEPTQWMEAYDHYKPTKSGYASCRDHTSWQQSAACARSRQSRSRAA